MSKNICKFLFFSTLSLLKQDLFPGDFGKKKTDSLTLSHEKIIVNQDFKAKIIYFDSKKNKIIRSINNLNLDSNNLFLAGIDEAGSMINSSLKDISEIEILTPLSRPNPNNQDTMLTKIKLTINDKKKNQSTLTIEIESKTLIRGNLDGTEDTIFSRKISDIYKIENISSIPSTKTQKENLIKDFVEKESKKSSNEATENDRNEKNAKKSNQESLTTIKKKPGLLQNLKLTLSSKIDNFLNKKKQK